MLGFDANPPRFAAALLIIVTMMTTPARADPPACPEPGQMVYPVAEILIGAGMGLQHHRGVDDGFHPFNSPEARAQRLARVSAALEGRSAAEADALMLARLQWEVAGYGNFVSLLFLDEVVLWDRYLDLLDRHGLTRHARHLRALPPLFTPSDVTPEARRRQAYPPGGPENVAITAAMDRIHAAFMAATPPLLEVAEALLRADESWPHYAERLARIDDWTKLDYLTRRILRCVRVETPQELAALRHPLADLWVMEVAIRQNNNGHFHQFVFNRSGAWLPELIAVMERLGLGEHAARVSGALKLFPADYPRDQHARRAIMAEFTERQDNVLYDLTGWLDNQDLYDAMLQLARDSKLLPR